MILGLVAEAVGAGARQCRACEMLGISSRMVERWRRQPNSVDGRQGPNRVPSNRLSAHERDKILSVVNKPEFRDLAPKQIVPKLADEGTYLASESTIYRILKAANQDRHREPTQPRKRSKPNEYAAHGPLEVWSWDITYLPASVRGSFYYLYLFVDIWSRKIVGWRVEHTEDMELSAQLMDRICGQMGIDPTGLVLHSDNGGPMKGATMLATLQSLGVVASFSRPHVSNDNPYSESLFRTLKYRPWYPRRRFASIDEARNWVAAFVHWYNDCHLHSAIGYVTPSDRHNGRDRAILNKRQAVYEQARRKHPERWSKNARKWQWTETVTLNPDKATGPSDRSTEAAA